MSAPASSSAEPKSAKSAKSSKKISKPTPNKEEPKSTKSVNPPKKTSSSAIPPKVEPQEAPMDKGPVVLGRSLLSWCLTVVYLLCLWSVLGAIFVGCLWLLCWSLDDGPRFYGGRSFIGGKPHIQFKRWKEIANEYANNRAEENYLNNTRLCKGRVFSPSDDADANRFCRMDDEHFGHCNPINANNQTLDRCWALRLNRILGYIPEIHDSTLGYAVRFNCSSNSTTGEIFEMYPKDGISLEHWNFTYTASALKWYEQPVFNLYVFRNISGSYNITCEVNVKNVHQPSVSRILQFNHDMNANDPFDGHQNSTNPETLTTSGAIRRNTTAGNLRPL
ncbi:hypothetical protein QR680_009351 [Steinernema hermaphroditum]|uniref:Uncharacterized protein n=1 Tax=Steinernema hermaphroditum TaxID=289476 RepID=A0AA39IJY7_9BILA|nr:hypothetical protein QR680_009351 [Steinernema hermaphroditum]